MIPTMTTNVGSANATARLPLCRGPSKLMAPISRITPIVETMMYSCGMPR